MGMRRFFTYLVGVLALLAIPATAAAQEAPPPPSSELDQYVPTYPDAKGDKELGGKGGGRDGGGGGGGGGDEAAPPPEGSAVAPETTDELESQGPAGEAAA